jgi:nicotinamidase/pyrazinamidase
VDIQNDFMPGGALAVPAAEKILAPIHAWMDRFDVVAATQDWHPANHGSFASQHPGAATFTMRTLGGLPQILWPDHCVQWTAGACLAPGLDSRRIHRIFPKGTDPMIDSYSGFYDNGHLCDTGLAHWLRARGVTAVWIVGLATDYCVKATAIDAVDEGFRTTVLLDACRGVFLGPDDEKNTLAELRGKGITLWKGEPEL